MLKPSPVPFSGGLVVKNGSRILSRMAGSTPHLVAATAILWMLPLLTQCLSARPFARVFRHAGLAEPLPCGGGVESTRDLPQPRHPIQPKAEVQSEPEIDIRYGT